MKDVEQQIRLVGGFQIECVLVGGVAATIHGSSIPTQDLDISKQSWSTERRGETSSENDEKR
jgi:hypothetical protein